MSRLSRAIAPCVLLAAAISSLRAQDVPMLRLSLDQSTHSLQIQSFIEASVFLVLGQPASPRIRIGTIDLDVHPEYVLSLGLFEAGEIRQLVVPRGMQALHALSAEAVSFDAENFVLRDSNVVRLSEAFRDLIDASFRADLLGSGMPPVAYRVDVALTAATSGYELSLDGVELSELTVNVYLRLSTPAEGELVMQVLTDHALSADLGDDLGKVVHVYMLRAQRGGVGPQVYELMAELPMPGIVR